MLPDRAGLPALPVTGFCFTVAQNPGRRKIFTLAQAPGEGEKT